MMSASVPVKFLLTFYGRIVTKLKEEAQASSFNFIERTISQPLRGSAQIRR